MIISVYRLRYELITRRYLAWGKSTGKPEHVCSILRVFDLLNGIIFIKVYNIQ